MKSYISVDPRKNSTWNMKERENKIKNGTNTRTLQQKKKEAIPKK